MTKVCANGKCGREYVYNPARPNQVYCGAECKDAARTTDKHAARDSRRAVNATKFIGVDGEGVDVWRMVEEWDSELDQMVLRGEPTHEYVLISVGDKSYHNNGEMLTFQEIFQFLYAQKEANPDAAFVGFFLGYDFSQWFKTLPASRGYSLFHRDGIEKRKPKDKGMKFPFPVYHGGWEFDILGMKRFKLRPHVKRADYPKCVTAHAKPELIDECAVGGHNRHPYKWMYVCDAGSFFQTSLMNAINREKWLKAGSVPVVTEDEERILQAGKDNRATAKLNDAMIAYNVLENDVLGRLMNTVNDGFVQDGILLRNDQWFGPGQAAQKWLRTKCVPTGEKVREVVPAWAIEAARQSYYGGWFEIMMHGPVPGTTYSYDINSAYPFAIAQLPCLMHGEWTQGSGPPKTKLPRGSYQLIDARVVGKDEYIGAMPHRDVNGRIVRPRKTSGWYWQHEVDAARKAGVLATAKVDQWVRYTPCDCLPPVREIAEMYESRLLVGKNSPYGKSKKLVYNSAYGKFAQSVGEPRFSNSIYASMITAHCRMMILEAIATHPDKSAGVAMVATDSVTFLTPHPTIDVHADTLGKWDANTYENLSLMMPGLYWDDSSRESVRKGDTPTLKSRGVSARDLGQFIDRIDRKWAELIARGQDSYWPEDAPEVDIKVAFAIVSPKLAMHRTNWLTCGKVEWDNTRTLRADPSSKRVTMYPAQDRPGALRSHVWSQIPDEPRSSPYQKTFGAILDDDGMRIAAELLTPDGTIAAAFRGVLPNG